MKILISGAAGQLGSEIMRQLAAGGSVLGALPTALEGATSRGVDFADADLTDRRATLDMVLGFAPDAVINCAAYTQVDKCESERDAAFAVNAMAARNLAMACEAAGARLVHVSTDYVFDGSASEPIPETALPAPKSVYGATKLLGEEYVRDFCSRWFVVRTAWLYGREGGNFVKTMLRLARENGSVSVVDDQMGTPTNAEDLAHHLLRLAASEEYGLYHCTGNGDVCSWFDFTAEILRLWGVDTKMQRCTSAEFPRPAVRPAYSVLDNAMLRATLGDDMRDWKDALADFYRQMRDII